MENGEKDTTASGEKALGLFFCSKTDSEQVLECEVSGWCRNSTTLEEQQAMQGGPSRDLPSGVWKSLLF